MTIKEYRTEHGYSQIEMASKLGVSLGTLIGWERGVMNPNEENKKKLERLMNWELNLQEDNRRT